MKMKSLLTNSVYTIIAFAGLYTIFNFFLTKLVELKEMRNQEKQYNSSSKTFVKKYIKYRSLM